MNLDQARALASKGIVHPNEAATAGLVVQIAILDRLNAILAAQATPAAPTVPDEKPGKGAKVKSA